MKKIVLFLIFSQFLGQSMFSQLIEVGDSAEISVITSLSGDKLYEKFGHTAIRYKDDASKADMVFNYGIFNFNDKQFYFKFIKGETYYMLAAYDTKYFLEDNKGRKVIEQKLDLSKEQQQQLMDVLMVNYLPENREYLYNFIYNNCSTEPRNKIYNLFKTDNKRFKFNYSTEKKTFRQWVEKYTQKDSWLQFGIDLVFGKEADEEATKWEAMFLPENLKNELSQTVVLPDTADLPRKKLVKEEIILNNPKEKITSQISIKPIYATTFILLFVIIFTILGLVKRKIYRFIDEILFIVTGVAGVILFYLMFFSIHPMVGLNFNILWCNPFNLFLAIIIWFKVIKEANRFFFGINLLLQLLFLGVYITSFQVINIAFIPISIALLVRSIFWLYSRKWYYKRSRFRTSL